MNNRLLFACIMLFFFPSCLCCTRSSKADLSPSKTPPFSRSNRLHSAASRTSIVGELDRIPISHKHSIRRGFATKLLSAWGVLFVLSLLGNTIKRLLPIAMQPIANKDLNDVQTVAYIAWCVFMAYVEGYKAFHCKFVPLVVRRSLTLIDRPSLLNYLFAGPYSMGLFYATKKRKIISWAVTTGVMALVIIVKQLPYPWRSIIDGGVVCGLSFGAASLAVQFIRAMFGYYPDVDPCLKDTSSLSRP